MSSSQGPADARAVLRTARLYLVAPPLEPTRLRTILEAGVDVVQLRAKDAEDAHVIHTGRSFAAEAARAGVAFVVNDRADLAYALGADGVHLGQQDVPPAYVRKLLGPKPVIGRSTHSRAQIDAALAEHEEGLVDYIAVGPVHETPTKPGRPAVGLGLVRYAAAHAGEMPWFAIGGIDTRTIGAVVEAGARRVVVVRAIVQASDPAGAVRVLADSLAGS